MEHELMWHPITMLPTLEMVVNTALAKAEDQLATVYLAIQSYGLHNVDAIVQVVGMYEEQRHFFTIYAEQGRRWQQHNLTEVMRQQIDRFLTINAKATAVNAKATALLAMIHVISRHSQDENWSMALRTMISLMDDDVPTKAFTWACEVLQIWQKVELMRLWGLVWLAYGEVSEALWEVRLALSLWMDTSSEADLVTHAQTWELMIQCWIYQEDAANAIETVRTLVAFVDTHQDGLFTQPDGARLWMVAAYYRALVAEFALDYSTATMWYAEAQQRVQAVKLSADHPMRRLIAAGIMRTEQEAGSWCQA